MSESLPKFYLVRHGQTAWSVTGQHTGRMDLPLTPQGESAALALSGRLRKISFAKVWTSPRIRARKTCELAGYAASAVVDEDLAEWDYGSYEGLKTTEILERVATWNLFTDGAPGGESVADISARADRVVTKFRAMEGNALVFSSGHILRVIAARWLGLEAAGGQLLTLGTASLSILGYDHDRDEPTLHLWNERAPD